MSFQSYEVFVPQPLETKMYARTTPLIGTFWCYIQTHVNVMSLIHYLPMIIGMVHHVEHRYDDGSGTTWLPERLRDKGAVTRNLDSSSAESAKPIARVYWTRGPGLYFRQKSLIYIRSLESTHTPCLVEQTLETADACAPTNCHRSGPLECVFSQEGPL